MRLTHFSPKKFILDRSRKYEDFRGNFKPNGLWLSDEHGNLSWKKWRQDQGFLLDHLEYRTDLIIKMDNVLHLKSYEEICYFNRNFGRYLLQKIGTISWEKVKSEFDGIVISPYDWKARNEFFWYSGWDCSSGCVWNLGAIEDIN